MRLIPPALRKVVLAAAAITACAGVPALGAAAPQQPLGGGAAGFASTHFGDGNLPAGCIVDRDEMNPDNTCFHAKVGLNELDSPKVNVAVLVPVSPTAERDMRIMRQAVEMWGGGIDHLAEQMNMKWLADGVEFNVTTKLVPVDANGLPTKVINLVSPKVVVIATNPVGGIGIGIDPADFLGEVGITDGTGAPCTSLPNPFSFDSWQARPGFDSHHDRMSGTLVQPCTGTGGQVCFAINGAIDPVPGTTDFFSIYDLVSHEVGHCLTLGHVGDGAEGAWGAIPTNDIMAYSSDPVDKAKCVSTLNVEGFALRMSRYLDVNRDGKVDERDVLMPNDVKGDGLNSFQVQNPKDHWYASSTGDPEDCPQPDWGALPIAAETDWGPKPVSTRTAKLTVAPVVGGKGKVSWSGRAAWVSTKPVPTKTSGSVTDETGDGPAPMTDITGFTASVTSTAVKATVKVSQLWPTTDGGRVTGYGLYVGGRKFDSFVTTQGTSSEVQTIDSGARYIMPAGTSTWDTAASTVSFTIPRSYLAQHRIVAPYGIFASSGVHIRTKDWVTTLDRAPNTGSLALAGPAMTGLKKDAPMDTRVTSRTLKLERDGGNTFTPGDTSTYGLPLVPQVGNVHQHDLPIAKQATAAVTLTWDDPGSFLGLEVRGGSGQVVKSTSDSVTVTVPWAHRDLVARVIPTQIGAEEVHYTLTAKLTTLTADADKDGVPDIADVCKTAPGPMTSGGCPDSDRDGVLDKKDACPKFAGTGPNGCPDSRTEKVVAFLDGKKVATTYVMSRHGSYDFTGSAAARKGSHTLKLVWYAGSTVVKTITQKVTVR